MKTYIPKDTEVFFVPASDFLNDDGTWMSERLDEEVTTPEPEDDEDATEYEEERQAEAARLEGWYWWTCCPGCLPDSDASGPFASEEEAIEDAGGGEYEDYIVALAGELGCEPSEIEEERHEHYGLRVLSYGREEYAIGTDEEADEACLEYVRDSVWAFRASFILSECGLPQELSEAIEAYQSEKCESANDALLSLVKRTCGLEDFTSSAISADGRGHFLASYDSDEMELSDGYVAFRIN